MAPCADKMPFYFPWEEDEAEAEAKAKADSTPPPRLLPRAEVEKDSTSVTHVRVVVHNLNPADRIPAYGITSENQWSIYLIHPGGVFTRINMRKDPSRDDTGLGILEWTKLDNQEGSVLRNWTSRLRAPTVLSYLASWMHLNGMHRYRFLRGGCRFWM